MKNIISLFIIMMIASSCGTQYNYISYETFGNNIVDTADLYIGMHERTNRRDLRKFVGVDPVSTEWCAAFVNSVLEKNSVPGSELVSENPLMARSFMNWGEDARDDPKTGDIVVFPRGGNNWQGHVGFFVISYFENDVEYYIILGGNQNDEVSYEAYEAKKAIAVRRWPHKVISETESHRSQ